MSLLVISKLVKNVSVWNSKKKDSDYHFELCGYRLIDTSSRRVKVVSENQLIAGLKSGIEIANAKLVGNDKKHSVALRSKYEIGRFVTLMYDTTNIVDDWDHRKYEMDRFILSSDGETTLICDAVGKCEFIENSEVSKLISGDKVANMYNGKLIGFTREREVRDGNDMAYFKYKQRLKTLDAEDGFEINSIDGKIVLVKYNGERVAVRVPDFIEVIGGTAFRYNKVVESVVLGKSVEKICEKAFYNSSKLKSISLNNGLKVIGHTAFGGTALKELIIPESIESVGERIIYGCNLEYVELKTKNINAIIDTYAFSMSTVTRLKISKEAMVAILRKLNNIGNMPVKISMPDGSSKEQKILTDIIIE